MFQRGGWLFSQSKPISKKKEITRMPVVDDIQHYIALLLKKKKKPTLMERAASEPAELVLRLLEQWRHQTSGFLHEYELSLRESFQ